jgi:glutathione synthase/RimK-type ligase-like ATP-grasp enzyme
MKTCAFLTLKDPADFVIDDEHAFEPMADLGWDVSAVPWCQTERPWTDFDAVIIRSTWDYPPVLQQFLETLETIDAQTRLANPIELVWWNLSKTYLRDLESAGVGIVPTLWVDEPDEDTLRYAMASSAPGDHVIKPVVGANGVDAFHLPELIPDARMDELVGVFHRRPCMIQPFMPNVISEGEFSLFYFNGQYSHAILKTPAAEEFRSQEERGARIKLVRPEARLRQRGLQTLECVSPRPLYARIDFVRDERSDFRVMEMELIEPSLYLRMHPDAPLRFARAIDEWYSAGRKPGSG